MKSFRRGVNLSDWVSPGEALLDALGNMHRGLVESSRQIEEDRRRHRQMIAEIRAFYEEGRSRASKVFEAKVGAAWRSYRQGKITRERREKRCRQARQEYDDARNTLEELAATRFDPTWAKLEAHKFWPPLERP